MPASPRSNLIAAAAAAVRVLPVRPAAAGLPASAAAQLAAPVVAALLAALAVAGRAAWLPEPADMRDPPRTGTPSRTHRDTGTPTDYSRRDNSSTRTTGRRPPRRPSRSN